MKLLISSVLLIVISVCTRLPCSVADPENLVIWKYCDDSEYTIGSAFQRNLNQVLESLVMNVYPSGFNTTSTVDDGQNSNSTVYGLVQCRGDLDSSDCKQCASTAKEKLVKACSNISGFIQLDGCVLRYDYRDFYNNLITPMPPNLLCNTNNSTQPQNFTDAVDALLSNITSRAAQSPEFFAAAYSLAVPTEYVYMIAQCWKDLSPTSCGSCLSSASSKIKSCPFGGLGAQVGSMNCYLRYENYKFYNTSVLPPPPPPRPSPRPTPPPPGATPRGSGGKISKVLGITLAATLGLIAVICLSIWKFVRRRKYWEDISGTNGPQIGEGRQIRQISLCPAIANQEIILNYDILREATSNFKAENKLGEGGFGSVYKGILPDDREVAVKRLHIGSRQGNAEFLNEANLISRIQHRNLVKLLGCSIENSERLLVYEYLPNSSLDKILFDTTKRHLLGWNERYEIIVGTARGLAYLHEESDIRIIHRDIKASNILLDNKLRPKIADFGLAKFIEEDKTHVSTRVAGTIGYIAPESLRGQLTEKADVFSFGVLVLEIISGRKSLSLYQDMEFLNERTWKLYNEERALEVMDPTLEGGYSYGEGIRMIKIGLLCTQASASLRPSMSRVVSMLTCQAEHLPLPTRSAYIDLDSVGTPAKTSSSRATSSTISSC